MSNIKKTQTFNQEMANRLKSFSNLPPTYKDHTKETIKANLYSTCGEINVFDDKVVISYGANSSTYTLERVINPQTGNNKILYALAIVSVLAIIGIGIFAKKKLFSKED